MTQEAARRRPWPQRLALGLLQLLAIAAITVALGEVAVRAVLGLRPLTPASFIFEGHPRWGWHHVPNAEGTFVKIGFQQDVKINSRGLREREEVEYAKPPGVFRVLVLGDSAVAGFEVPAQAVFPRVAEEILRARGVETQWINAGVRGWGTDQCLLFLQDEGLRYQPDLVLYNWNGNDRSDNRTVHRPYRVYGKPWFTQNGDGRLELHGVPVPQFDYVEQLMVGEDGELKRYEVPASVRFALLARDELAARSAFAASLVLVAANVPALTQPILRMGSFGDHRGPAVKGNPLESRLFHVTAALVAEMERSAAQAGARFQMIGKRHEFSDALRRETGLPEIDYWERFQARIPSEREIRVRFDPHYNELGHRLYAENLVEALLAAGYLPISP